jgi:hypothetical protein
MDNSSERMKRLREKRKKAGLKEYRLWLNHNVIENEKGYLKTLENISLAKETKLNLSNTKNQLNERLKKYKTWDEYYKKVYGMVPERRDYPTRKCNIAT